MHFLSLAVMILLLSGLNPVNCQTVVYPVSVTTRLTPPYSVNLADYAAPGCDQLRVIILQRDLSQAPYRLYLRMEISLNGRVIIRTSPEYYPPALTLDPGIPTVISGSDLSAFFDPAHMEFTGYSREAYMRNKLLPEGAYTINFTAYDYARRSVALSSGGSFFCYLARSEPPLLNLPVNGSFVHDGTPQFINFQWHSRNVTSPNSVFSTRYRLELFEMRAGGMTADDVAGSTRPVFTAETEKTSYTYTVSDPALEKGIRYVWRVRAYDTGGRDYIRNDGYSEVFSFIYGGQELIVKGAGTAYDFTATAVSPSRARLLWNTDGQYGSYTVFYRKKGGDSRWYEAIAEGSQKEISGLTPGTVYECRVQGQLGKIRGEMSDIDTVLTPLRPVIECGSAFTPATVSNREPLLDLMRLQEFDAGGFIVTVTDPAAVTTMPGVFSGRGFVQVPLFGHVKIRCEFTDVFINTDYQMLEGSVRLITDNSEGNNALWNIDDVFEGGGDNGKVVDGSEEVSVILPDVVITDARSLMLDTATKEIIIIDHATLDTIRVDAGSSLQDKTGSLTVKDSEGNLYSISTQTGKATSLGKAAPQGSPQQLASLPSVIDSGKGKVIFEQAPVSRFAFDVRDTKYSRSNLFMEEYETMVTSDGSTYDVPFKLIPTGETDVVLARLEDKGRSVDSIVFRSGTGTIYRAEQNKKNEYLLTLPSGKAGDGIDIYATWTDQDGKVNVLGKLKVISYTFKKPELTLVPVSGNGADIDPVEVKKELDKVYLPVAVDWQVSIDNSDFSADADGLDIKGSGMFSMYTEGMKRLNEEFIMHKGNDFNPSTVYLFLLPESEDGNATGDMPRGRQFGYVFTKTAGRGGLHRTIAHEIAHGAFSLSHTFDSKYQITEKSTTNLLDYTAGTDLVKHQWDAIHDPGLVIGMFERDEEGMMSIFGITWLGNILWGLAPDAQESQVELDRTLYKHVYQKYIDYFSDSKVKDTPVELAKYQDWTIRKASHQGVAKKVFMGLKEERTSFTLHTKGIFFEEYTLEGMTYKVAVYSNPTAVNLNQDIRIKSFRSLRYNKSIKIGYTNESGLICFYDSGGKLQMILQISGGSTPKETVMQWVNYLGLLLPSEEQVREDEELSVKENLKNVKLNDEKKLNEIWGNISDGMSKESNFEKYQEKIFDHEGGYVDNKNDKGGKTNKGITLKTFEAYAEEDLGIKPTLDNLKKLTNEQAAIIYKKRYWDEVKADEINNGNIAFMLYDFSVTSLHNAIKVLQRVLIDMGYDIIADGFIGEKTLNAINNSDSKALFDKFKKARLKYYQDIVDASVDEYKEDNPNASEDEILKNTQKQFEKGWKDRVNSINYEED